MTRATGASERQRTAYSALAFVVTLVAVSVFVSASPARAETAYGLTTTNQLVLFDIGAPSTLLELIPLTGLQPGETIVGIDFRPLDGQLYGVGLSGGLYRINARTGRVFFIGFSGGGPLVGTAFGVDFNPTVDRLRVVSDADINLSINPNTGVATVQGPLNPGNPTISEVAYSSNHVGAATTTLYGIDTASDELVIQNPPANGTIVSVGALGVNATALAGFDIPAHGNQGYAVLEVGGVSGLYRINLSGGLAQLLGATPGNLPLRGFTILARQVPIWTYLPATNELVRFDSADPDVTLATIPVTGLQGGETLLGYDFRPATGELYAVGSTNRLYVIDTTNGAATQIGPGPFAPLLNGAVGFDFHPALDRIRVITSSGQNLRIVPDTGVVFVDTPINPPTGLQAVAYSNNVGDAQSATLFGQTIGLFAVDMFMIGGVNGDPSPNTGTTTFVGDASSGLAQTFTKGFDISGADGAGFGVAEFTDLYAFNVLTGDGRPIGFHPGPAEGLAIEPPGRLQFENTQIFVLESGPEVAITINRVGGSAGPISIDYAVTSVTADPSDFTPLSGTLIFLDGETSKTINVPINQEALDEDDEVFLVELSNPFLGTSVLGSDTAIVTIVDDDPPGSLPPTITITTPTTDPNFLANTSVLALAGTAVDDAAVVAVLWFNDRGGNGLAIGTDNWSVPFIPLLPGVNGLTVTAFDANGKSASDTLTVTLNVKTYSFAEGATGPFFDTDLLLGNPNAQAAPVTVTYLKDTGETVVQNLNLPPLSRTTVLVDEIPGMESTSFSTTVDSTSGLSLAVERTQRWDTTGYGAHTEKASESASLTWYFAEGSQGFFQTFLLLGNPGGVVNQATVTFLLEGGGTVIKQYDVAPRSRLTVYAGDIPQLVERAFGMAVTFTQPGLAERAMYFGTRLFEGGHAAAGVIAPATTWFLAEGATGDFFQTFVLLANPGATDANVTVTYLRDAGAPVIVNKIVPAFARLTIDVATEHPSLANVAVATRIVSDQPIVSERAMYWPGLFDTWLESHGSFGVTGAQASWALAEGRVGGSAEYETYILLANPNVNAITATVTYFRTNGTTLTKDYVVAGQSRFNIHVNGLVPELADEEFSALVTATAPIVVERALYSNSAGVTWAAGTSAVAVPFP